MTAKIAPDAPISGPEAKTRANSPRHRALPQKSHEIPAIPQAAIDRRAEYEQRQHVARQVPEAGMSEGIRQHAERAGARSDIRTPTAAEHEHVDRDQEAVGNGNGVEFSTIAEPNRQWNEHDPFSRPGLTPLSNTIVAAKHAPRQVDVPRDANPQKFIRILVFRR